MIMKAQEDMIYWLAMVFAVSIAVIVLLYIFTSIFAAFKLQPAIANNPNAVIALNKGQQSIDVIANALVIVYIIMAVASCILSFFVDSSPIFLVVIFVVLPIELLIAFIFHDIFFDIVNQSIFGATATGIPILIQFFQWLPVLCLGFSSISAIVTFAKR